MQRCFQENVPVFEKIVEGFMCLDIRQDRCFLHVADRGGIGGTPDGKDQLRMLQSELGISAGIAFKGGPAGCADERSDMMVFQQRAEMAVG